MRQRARLCLALICGVIANAASAAEPLHGSQAIALLDEIWQRGRDEIYPRALADRFTPSAKAGVAAQLRAPSSPPLADVLIPFLRSLGVSHTRFFDIRYHDYYMLKSLFGTRDMDTPALDQLGLQFETLDTARVRAVLQGFPAVRAGLQRGDRIVAVDGVPFQSLLDWQGMPSAHRFTIERGGPEPERFDVTMTPVRMGLHRALLEATEHSVRTIGCGARRIGYLQLWSGTDERFLQIVWRAVREEFIDADGVILDLRDGYGGAWWPYLDPFFPEREDYFVSQTFDANGAQKPATATPQTNPDAYTGPMAVLINAGTRSGKESLAYQFVKTHRARVIGSTTAGAFSGGKGMFAERDAGYVMYLSVFELRLDGRVIEGIGVAPDIAVPARPGVDAPMRRALRELGCAVETKNAGH